MNNYVFPFKNPSLSPEERAEDLLSRMTLREKAAQLDLKFGNNYCTKVDKNHNCSVDENSDYDWDKLKRDFPDGLGYLHDNYSVPSVMNKLQKFFISNSRLGIPVIFTGEALHGISGTRGTILPIPTAIASTFEPDYAFRAGRVIAKEAASLGIREVLAPNLDVAREPRWGRTEETFGEDTCLSSNMAVGIVKGHQNGDISQPDSVISEPKHYCVHGIAEAGLNCAVARAGKREIDSCYLPVFEAAIKEGGAYDVMVSYNCIDGDVLMASDYYLRKVLKEKFGLKGICRSDWGGIIRIKEAHKLTATDEGAVYLAKKNGLDCQGGSEYPNKFWVDTIEKLVNEGKISEENINESCRRVLKLKFTLGLFENPYTDEDGYKSVINKKEHLDLALEIAQKSAILLKNDGILPIENGRYKKIALIGPSGNKVRLGGYSAIPVGRIIPTVYDVLKKELPGSEILQADGCGISEDKELTLAGQQHLLGFKADRITDNINEAVKIAQEADLIIFCGGDDGISSGEGRDRCELTLCGNQPALVGKLAETGKPLISVIIHGKPLVLTNESRVSDAVLSCWFGGECGAQAICDVLTGKVNPSGKLPFSLPVSSTRIPCYYSMLPGASNEYYEGSRNALYPFGFGLSYTSFDYSDLKVDVTDSDNVKVSVTVKNTGKYDGDEVVQIYVEDCESSVVTPDILLKAFKRVSLRAGESMEVVLKLDNKAFSLVNVNYEKVIEPGDFIIYAGASSRELRLKEKITITPEMIVKSN
ncbi:MAG: glycoside hydrolase family 3 C-terminal domain-containing protein [Clostridia bacterium]|nr:glycoside hydrolase family 3 C-terminal domain-containing protein [Clostridia bacterium]